MKFSAVPITNEIMTETGLRPLSELVENAMVENTCETVRIDIASTQEI